MTYEAWFETCHSTVFQQFCSRFKTDGHFSHVPTISAPKLHVPSFYHSKTQLIFSVRQSWGLTTLLTLVLYTCFGVRAVEIRRFPVEFHVMVLELGYSRLNLESLFKSKSNFQTAISILNINLIGNYFDIFSTIQNIPRNNVGNTKKIQWNKEYRTVALWRLILITPSLRTRCTTV